MPSNQDFKVTPDFWYSELIHSNTAMRLNLPNTPTEQHKQNLIEACTNLWQPMRKLLDKPVHINSGYRSLAVNNAVGGSKTSAHSVGFAIDFTAPSFGHPRFIAEYLAKELQKNGIKFDQIILEFPESPSCWVHIGYKSRDGRQREQVLTAVKRANKTVYLEGIR